MKVSQRLCPSNGQTTSLPKLYKRTETGKVQEWQITIDGNSFYIEEGLQGGKQTRTKPTVCGGKNLGRSNETTPEEQAYLEARAKWKKKCESGYFEKLGQIDAETFFEPMLAHKWEDYKDKVKFPVWCQPKLDGIRCIAKKDGLWSRNGKRIVACPHIEKSLAVLFEGNPDLILDGELYADKFANDFNTICSLVKRTKPSKEDLEASEKSIEYWVYDIPGYLSKTAPPLTFGERTRAITALLAWANVPSVKCLTTHCARDKASLDQLYEKWLELGYEGQMVRLDAPYENKRSKNLLKRKEFQDEEFKILEVHEGFGNRTGTVGFFVLLGKDGVTSFRSNVKGSHEYLASLLKDRKRLIGQLATVKFFNYTPDQVPRFPFVIKIGKI